MDSNNAKTDYGAELEAWRQSMDTQMRAPGPGGWLAIVGMYPLKQGENTVGSAANSDILLPAEAPEHVGIIDFKDQHGTLVVTADQAVTVDGLELTKVKLRNYYEPGGMSVVRVHDISFGIMQWASDPYNVRVWDANSPKRLNFQGRAWFPINPQYRVQGVFTAYDQERDMTVEHTGGKTQELINIGTVDFELFGQAFHFEAAVSELGPEYVWILMRDGTTGASTYGAGRFMMAALESGTKVDLDFNKLYHPPCAFCDFTTCPMPPRSNVIPFAVEAGECFPGT